MWRENVRALFKIAVVCKNRARFIVVDARLLRELLCVEIRKIGYGSNEFSLQWQEMRTL